MTYEPRLTKPEQVVDGIWDWGFLRGCLGSDVRCTPSDLDGFLTRHSEVLLFEGKAESVAELPTGQRRAFRTLALRGCTILILWGRAENPAEPWNKTPTRAAIWRKHKHEPEKAKAVTVDDVRTFVAKWWEKADTKEHNCGCGESGMFGEPDGYWYCMRHRPRKLEDRPCPYGCGYMHPVGTLCPTPVNDGLPR